MLQYTSALMRKVEFKPVIPGNLHKFQADIKPFMQSSDFYPVTALGYGLGEKISYFADADFAILQYLDYVEPGNVTSISMRPNLSKINVHRAIRTLQDNDITRLRLVPQQSLEIIQKVRNYKFRYLSGDADYLYETKKLSEMDGPCLRRRRREVNRLKKTVNTLRSEIKCILNESDKCDVRKLMRLWELNRGTELESDVVQTEYFLEYHNITNTQTALIWDGKDLISFCVFERLANDIGVFHFVKAHPQYRGATSYVLQQVAKSLNDEGTSIVNFAFDVGRLGLREYKQSLRPVKMIKKAEVWL